MAKKSKICCIYTITCLVNNKVYVGRAVDFAKRKVRHFYKLKKGNHDNLHLQRSYDKYGKENFLIEILEEYEEEFLLSMENWWANVLNSHNRDFGYNIRGTGIDNHYKFSAETIERMSKAKKGKKGVSHTEESKLKIGNARRGKPGNSKGKKRSEETKEKLRVANTGKKHTEEAIEKIRISSTGRLHTEESKQKIREKSLLYKHSDESKKKISDSKKGKKRSEESKIKQSETTKGKKMSKESVDKMLETKLKKGIISKINK